MTLRHVLARLWLLLGLCLAGGPLLAADPPVLQGHWRALDAAQAEWTRFEPARLSRIPRQPQGAELQLWVEGVDEAAAAADRGEWLLVIRRPALERFLRVGEDGEAVVAALLSTQRSGWRGHGRIAFAIDALPTAASPFVLQIQPQPAINGTVAFALQTAEQFHADEARWLALVATCLAVLGGMGVIALVFALRLRDMTFAWYAGYLFAYAGIQLLQTGFIASPLGWAWLAEHARVWGRWAVVLSVLMATLFLIRFAALADYSPRARRVLLVFAGMVALNALLGILPLPGVQPLSTALLNPLLILGGPLLLLVAAHAWWRGSRYAGFFVIGWTPLLGFTIAGSLQLYGLWSGWLWSGEAALVAAAFEALVLSAGLADRTASVRRDRDIARALAERDPLTGMLNRGALLAALQGMLGDPRTQPLAVLFCDLDHFKALNDSHGHAAGDRALLAVADVIGRVLRESDLVGRYGGEEFVLVLPRCPATRAADIAERLRATVAADAAVGVTVSIGIAIAAPGESVDELLQRADRALYVAKDRGRNRVVAAERAPSTVPA